MSSEGASGKSRWWRHVGAALLFGAGVALTLVSYAWRWALHDSPVPAPEYLVATAGSLGTLAALLRAIGKALWDGRSVGEAVGLDDTRKTSRFTLVMASLLFVPLWAVSIGMSFASLRPDSSIRSLLGWSLVALFLSGIVFSIVREWRKPAPGTRPRS